MSSLDRSHYDIVTDPAMDLMSTLGAWKKLAFQKCSFSYSAATSGVGFSGHYEMFFDVERMDCLPVAYHVHRSSSCHRLLPAEAQVTRTVMKPDHL